MNASFPISLQHRFSVSVMLQLRKSRSTNLVKLSSPEHVMSKSHLNVSVSVRNVETSARAMTNTLRNEYLKSYPERLTLKTTHAWTSGLKVHRMNSYRHSFNVYKKS